MKHLVFLTTLALIACSRTDTTTVVNEDSLRRAKYPALYGDPLSKLDSSAAPVKELGWKVKSFVDQFGDDTKERYISALSMGTFSNSATSDSPLFVEIIMAKDKAGIFLKEYKITAPGQKIIGAAEIWLKNKDGKTVRVVSVREWSQSEGIMLHTEDYGDFPKFKKFLLQSSGDVKVVINDKYSSKYNFAIKTDGLKEAFAGL